MNPGGVDVDFFVSHYWGHNFRSTLSSLEKFAEKRYKEIGKASADEVVFWICLFALDQHRPGEEVRKQGYSKFVQASDLIAPSIQF